MDIDISTPLHPNPAESTRKKTEPQIEPTEKTDTLKEYGQVSMPQLTLAQMQQPQKSKNPRGNICYLPIIGHIEGHINMPPNTKTTKYEHVIPLLLNVAESSEIEGLFVVLNTVGGDVEAGLAISELIANIGKPVVSLVLGGGHSIGVPLAVCAECSFIAPSATMTIHPVRMNGTIIGTPQTYEYFNKTQERIVEFIVSHSGISKKRLRELMLDTEKLALDVGTILIGEEAVKEKLIDHVGGLHDAMEKMYEYIDDYRSKAKIKKD